MFYDKLQLIQGFSIPKFIEKADCRLTLYKNCRNTKKIAETSFKPLRKEPKLFDYALAGVLPELSFITEENIKEKIDFTIKQALVNEISPDNMYSSIKEEKFTIHLSEEILDLATLEYNEGLLSETVKIRQNLTEKLGYVIPHIHFHNADDLEQNEFSIRIHDIEVFKGFVFTEHKAYYKDELKGYSVDNNDLVVLDNITGKKNHQVINLG